MAQHNYITPRGLERIRLELEWLHSVERPRVVKEVSDAAALGDRSENAEYIYGKKKLRQIDGRRRYLVKRLERAQLVDPTTLKSDKVLFGATVVIVDENDREQTWKIYGEDEVDVARGVLSWRSPLARALLGKSEGDVVQFSAPGGRREVELVGVRYDEQTPLEEVEWRTAFYARA